MIRCGWFDTQWDGDGAILTFHDTRDGRRRKSVRFDMADMVNLVDVARQMKNRFAAEERRYFELKTALEAGVRG